MDADEKASFAYGGQRASKRKGIERSLLNGVTYLKPPGSCHTKWPPSASSAATRCMAAQGLRERENAALVRTAS